MRNLPTLSLALALLLGVVPAAGATPYDAPAKALLASAKFKAAKASLAAGYDRIVGDLVTLTEVEAPPFQEKVRGELYAKMLKEAGLAEVQTDAEGNVFGYRRGTGGGPLIVVTGHLDTVFPAGTPVKVKRTATKLAAPGIGDDTSSLAVLLGFIRAMDAAKVQTKADLIFMGNVGEEGPGDLRGTRYLFTRSPLKDKIAYFISFEPGEAARITDAGVGSRRYKVTFTGPGGHSYGAFGLVSPAYALGQAMVDFGRIQVPKTPKTTFNVGLIEGGTSVNSIPFAMSMTIDMRSEGKAELAAVEQEFLAILPKAVAAENAARSTTQGKIGFEAKLIGDRPVGATPRDSDILQIATAVAKAGGKTPSYGAGSTDSNIPMSLGKPAMTLGSGFKTERPHALDEALTLDKPADVDNMALGLATVMLLAGAR